MLFGRTETEKIRGGAKLNPLEISVVGSLGLYESILKEWLLNIGVELADIQNHKSLHLSKFEGSSMAVIINIDTEEENEDFVSVKITPKLEDMISSGKAEWVSFDIMKAMNTHPISLLLEPYF